MTGQLWPGQLWPTLLAEAWAALSGESGDTRLPAGLEVLWVSGAPGNLPSRLPAEDVAIACAGAALLAAAALHAQRGGDSGSRGSPVVQLDRGHIAAAFRSEAFLRVDGEPAGPGFAPLSRFWRAADGWVRTHGNYPWHRAALLRALGCADDPEPVATAIADLGARQAEDLVTGAGGVAAAVRDEASWHAEPPGQAVAATPLVEATSVGGAPPRWRPAGELPASGIRVLDLTRVIAGPVATRYLGALGADVLRLDPPDRPELTMQTYDGLLAKRSALLDFGVDGGLDRLHDLLSGADVLVHGYRPHALDRFGLDPQTLAERHPGLVVVSLSAWGSRGPWGGRRGFDSIVQAASGIAMAESPDGERPGALPCQLLDHGTGYLCAAAALQALARQSARGGTQFRELSLARTAHWLLGQPREALPREALPRDAPGSAPAPADDEWTWLTTLDSAAGPVTTVLPPGRLDDEPLTWPRALSRYGADDAAWPRLPSRCPTLGFAHLYLWLVWGARDLKVSTAVRTYEVIERIDVFCDAVPRRRARADEYGPLVLFVPTGPGWPYYARPRRGPRPRITAADIRAVRARQRELIIPESFEWIEQSAPDMAAAAAEAGLEVQTHPLMVLSARPAAPAALPAGVAVRAVAPEDPELDRVWAVPAVAFGHPGTATGEAGPAERDKIAADHDGGTIEMLRERLRSGQSVLAAAFGPDGPLAAGSCQAVDGVAEITGVGVLPSSRRQGLGAAITALLARDALDRDVQTVFLSASDDAVARVYARIGFREIGTAMIAEPPAG